MEDTVRRPSGKTRTARGALRPAPTLHSVPTSGLDDVSRTPTFELAPPTDSDGPAPHRRPGCRGAVTADRRQHSTDPDPGSEHPSTSRHQSLLYRGDGTRLYSPPGAPPSSCVPGSTWRPTNGPTRTTQNRHPLPRSRSPRPLRGDRGRSHSSSVGQGTTIHDPSSGYRPRPPDLETAYVLRPNTRGSAPHPHRTAL